MFKFINSKNFVKMFFVGFVLTLLYYRSIYLVVFFLIFFLEYIYFLSFVLDIYNNYNKYHVIKIKEFDISNKNVIEVWNEYCKTLAFRRIYLVLLRKKQITVKNVLTISLIIIFNIPFRFLKLCNYFIFKNKGEFTYGLNVLYTDSYYMLKNCKIEVLNRKIYINSYSLGELLHRLSPHCKNMSEQKLFNCIHDLKLAYINFNNYEVNNQKYIEICLAKIISKENVEISKHYTYKEGDNTMHATSNMSIKMLPSQETTRAMPSLVKKDATNPGTVITKSIKNMLTTRNIKLIPAYEIQSIKYDYLDLFDLSEDNYKYIDDKNKVFHDIIEKNLGYLALKDLQVYADLRNNCYMNDLMSISNSNIIKEIFTYKDII